MRASAGRSILRLNRVLEKFCLMADILALEGEALRDARQDMQMIFQTRLHRLTRRCS